MSAMAESRFANPSSSLPRWTNTLLVMGLAYLLAVLTLKLLPVSTSVDTSALSATGVSRDASPDPMQLGQAIAATHLFGNASAAPPAPEPEKPREQVETKLNLQLAGVLAYQPQERAIAIISAGSSEQSAYGVGDKVSGETRLKEVFPTYVVLDNRGRDEILRLPENSVPVAMRSIPDNNTAQMPAPPPPSEDFSQPVDLPSTPGALRDTLARNPSLLGRVVAAEPYQENGQLKGYRITPKQNPEILEAQGIVAGDVITSVNNIQLNSQKQGIRALRNAVKADSLEVTVLRDGVEVPLSISLAQ